VSSQDYSPAPYPFYTENGAAEVHSILESRPRERYWLYGLLFAITLVTATVTGAAMQADFDRNIPFDLLNSFPMYADAWRHPLLLLQGLPFSLTLLSILLAHEFGHYFAALYHRVDASLPYFLPSPFLGTFGAFIRIRRPIYSMRALFDIGVAGPVAGFVLLLPIMAIGLAFSKVVPDAADHGAIRFGFSGLQWLLSKTIFPGVPIGDIYLHPMARAAWVGAFATAMNLLPIGQLDGGHILYSFFPRRHRRVSKAVCAAMLIPAIVWIDHHTGLRLLPLRETWLGWSLWGLILLWLGRRHPAIHDPSPMSPGRRALGWLSLAMFLLCFMFDPFPAPDF
jgi:membrane-associated protease RseP (regulator of RpoE activity)